MLEKQTVLIHSLQLVEEGPISAREDHHRELPETLRKHLGNIQELLEQKTYERGCCTGQK
jgi:hypothetical protein